MPVCDECKMYFPNWMMIGGIKRNLHSRRYCISCSPFGRHNTRPLKRETERICICKTCNKRYIYDHNKGHCPNICNACVTSKRRVRTKLRAVAYLGGGCQECGYNKNPAALTFHHVDSSLKSFNICAGYNRSWTVVKQELNKCQLLCANCHAERHASLKMKAMLTLP